MSDNVTFMPERGMTRPDPLDDVRDALGAAGLQLTGVPGVSRADAARFLRALSAAGWGLISQADLLPEQTLAALPLYGVDVITIRADRLEPAFLRQLSEELCKRAGRTVALVALTHGATLDTFDTVQMRRAGWVRADG